MRYLLSALMLVSTFVWADSATNQFDAAQFEKRFHKADKDHKGKLSRQEAYAEFPRMPEFFDEIDVSKDNFITLEEVHRAMERRVDAAIDAGHSTLRHDTLETGQGQTASVPETADQPPQFSSKADQRRYYRGEFYESISADKSAARDRGEPTPLSPSSPLLKKSF